MDGRLRQLEEEFREASRRTAELKVQLDLASGKIASTGVPHYILIEQAAHEVGQEISRLAQQIHMRELVARELGAARCPGCQRRCPLELKRRTITSIDGPVELEELTGYCPSCRRAFFPSAGSAGFECAGADAAGGPSHRGDGLRDAVGEAGGDRPA